MRTDEFDGRANKAAGALRHSRKQREKHLSEQQRGQPLPDDGIYPEYATPDVTVGIVASAFARLLKRHRQETDVNATDILFDLSPARTAQS